jgi:hypothetical protein
MVFDVHAATATDLDVVFAIVGDADLVGGRRLGGSASDARYAGARRRDDRLAWQECSSRACAPRTRGERLTFAFLQLCDPKLVSLPTTTFCW